MIASAKTPSFPTERDSFSQDDFSSYNVTASTNAVVADDAVLSLEPEGRNGDWLGRIVALVRYEYT